MKQILFLLCLTALHFSLFAQAQPRFALVIGNGDYIGDKQKIHTTKNDAKQMEKTLKACGFDVTIGINLKRQAMLSLINQFVKKIDKKNGVILFYYSGHGLRDTTTSNKEYQSFLLPIDFPISYDDIELKGGIEGCAIGARFILEKIQNAQNKENILLLDACCSYFYKKGINNNNGLILSKISEHYMPQKDQGFLIGYAASPGEQANIGEKELSPYTQGLIEAIKTQQGEDINVVLGAARAFVVNKRYPYPQNPWYENNGLGQFYFYNPQTVLYEKEKAEGDTDFAKKAYLDALIHYKNALKYKPNDTYCTQKTKECEELYKKSLLPAIPSPKDIDGDGIINSKDNCPTVFGSQKYKGCPVEVPEMVEIEGGTFQMDSNYTVTLSNYAIGKYEVTIGQYLAFCKETKSHYPEWLEVGNEYNIYTGTQKWYTKAGCDTTAVSLPIVGVSHTDALAYCEWLSAKTDVTYKLPTEAQWQFAAMGGKKTHNYAYAGSNELQNVAWYDKNSDDKLHNIGTKNANELGLFDMNGNVWERCSDWCAHYPTGKFLDPAGAQSGNYKVSRGGCWVDDDVNCRISFRYDILSSIFNILNGFRVAR